MAVTDADLSAKGREVEEKFVEKWLEHEVPFFLLNANSDAVVGEVEEGFSGTQELFEWWNGRDPSGLQAMRDHLQNSIETFQNVVVGDLDTVKGQLSDWQGSAATDFGTWLGRMDPITENHVYLLTGLEKALEMVQALSEGSRDEVIAIGDQTLAVLDSLENSDDGGFSFGAALLAVVAGVAAGAVTGGVGGVLTIISVSASFAGAVSAEVQRREAQVSGDDVLEVFNSMAHALADLWDVHEAVSEDIANALTEDRNKVLELEHWYRQAEPELVSLDVSGGITQDVEDAIEPPRA